MKKNVDLNIPKIIQLPSGAYSTKVMVEGVRYTITKDTPEECAAEATAIKYRAKEAKKKEKTKSISLSDAIDRYIDSRRGSVSPTTIYGYERYKANCFRTMMASDVFTTTDEQWQAAIRREAKERSPKYVANAWGLIRASILEATGKTPRVNLPAKEKNERPYLDPEQVKVFVEAIKGDIVEIAALLALSSLRRSELRGLTWDCINFEKKTITVNGAMVYAGKDGGMIYKKQNKTAASSRIVPIIPPLEAALRSAERTSEYVVPLGGTCLHRRINRICAENNLPQIGVHGLRHSFASLAYHLQIPEKIAMEIGGWSDDHTMRKIYTHLAQKDIANRAKDFSNFFNADQ